MPIESDVGDADHDQRRDACPESRAASPGRRPRPGTERRAERGDPDPRDALRRRRRVDRRPAGAPRALRPARSATISTTPRPSASQVAWTPMSRASLCRLGAVQTCRPGGRAVLQERAEPEDLREHQPAQRKPGQRHACPGGRRSRCRPAHTAARRSARPGPAAASRRTSRSLGIERSSPSHSGAAGRRVRCGSMAEYQITYWREIPSMVTRPRAARRRWSRCRCPTASRRPSTRRPCAPARPMPTPTWPTGAAERLAAARRRSRRGGRRPSPGSSTTSSRPSV